jgi:glycosyltransferase involved in cell wall biosynthesis
LQDPDLARAYANCAVLVQTSRYEGFGMTPLEAMASGAPALISRASSMPEVGGEVARYFEPGDPESLAVELESLLTDGALRRELGRQGVLRAATFTTERMASATAAAYRSVL